MRLTHVSRAATLWCVALFAVACKGTAPPAPTSVAVTPTGTVTFVSLNATQQLAGEMEEYSYQLDLLDFHDALYEPDALAEHAWASLHLP